MPPTFPLPPPPPPVPPGSAAATSSLAPLIVALDRLTRTLTLPAGAAAGSPATAPVMARLVNAVERLVNVLLQSLAKTPPTATQSPPAAPPAAPTPNPAPAPPAPPVVPPPPPPPAPAPSPPPPGGHPGYGYAPGTGPGWGAGAKPTTNPPPPPPAPPGAAAAPPATGGPTPTPAGPSNLVSVLFGLFRSTWAQIDLLIDAVKANKPPAGSGSPGAGRPGATPAAPPAASGRTANPFGGLGDTLDRLGGSAATAQRGLAAIITGLDAALAGLGQQFVRFVGLSSPATVIRFNLAMRDTQAVMGQILTPILERFTAVVRKLGDAMASLSDPTRSLLGGLAAGSGLAGVFAGLAAAAAVLVRTLGGIPVAIATVVGAVAGVATTMGEWSKVSAALDEVMRVAGQGIETVARVALPPLLDAVGALAGVLLETHKAAAPLAEAVGVGLAAVFRVLEAVIRPLAPVVAANARALAPVIRLLAALSELVSTALEGSAAALGSLAEGLVSLVMGPLGDAIGWFVGLLDGLVRTVKGWVDDLRDMLGLPPLPDYDPNRNSSVGAAVRNAQITDIQSYINAAYVSAAQSGRERQQDKQLQKLGGIHEELKRLPAEIAKEIGRATGLDRARDVVRNTPVAGVPGVPKLQITLGDVADQAEKALDWMRGR